MRIWYSKRHSECYGKTVLKISKFPADVDPAVCPGQKVQLDFALGGMELPGNTYLVFSTLSGTGQKTRLDSVNRSTGRIQLTLPNNIPGDWLIILAEIPLLNLSQRVSYALYATPDMTLIGDNVITAGEFTSLYVRANAAFAYNTPFELSDGTSYKNTASFPGGLMEIKVSPATTTTYTIKPLQSTCGAAKVSGSATVTVQPKLAQSLFVSRVEGLRRFNLCDADTVQVYFTHQASQENLTGYEMLLSDSTGKNFTSIPVLGEYSPLRAVIPAGIRQSPFYRLRLISKNAKVSGSTYAESLRIAEHARAKVLTTSVLYQPGESVNVLIAVEGSLPASYLFGDDNFYRYRTARYNADTIALTPLTPAATYRISQLSNECGAGIIEEPAALKIELITGTEPAGETISFGPNPADNVLFIHFAGAASRNLEMFNVSGQQVFSGKYTANNATVELADLPAGIYLLRVTKNNAVTTYRIVKH